MGRRTTWQELCGTGSWEKKYNVIPLVIGRQHVDDVMLRLEAPTRELGRIMQTAAVKLVQRAQHLKLPEPDKTVLMPSSAKQAVVVQQGLRQCGLEVQRARVSPPPWNRMPHLGASGVSRVQPNGANKLRRV